MITLRPITYEDRQLFKASSYEALEEASLDRMISQSVAKEHNGQYFEVLAVLDSGICVGFLNLYSHSKSEVSCGPEIKPQYRRRGFAYAAQLQALDYAKRLGFKKAVAQVRKDNAASIALHRKLGFSLCNAFINQKGQPVYWFEKWL